MALAKSANVFTLDEYSVTRKNDAAIVMTATPADDGGSGTDVTFAISSAGTSGLTTAQILANIEYVGIFSPAGALLVEGSLDSSSVINIPTGGSQDIIARARVTFDAGRYEMMDHAAGW